MLLIDESNAAAYLRERGHFDSVDDLVVTPLTGGVSNTVLHVGYPRGEREDFVLKQAREQLRTPDPWFCTVERIWRETAVLRTLENVVPHGRTPRILFIDRENYLFAMSAAPREHRVWKHQLLDGHMDERIADQCGELLGAIHAGTWGDEQIEAELGDREVFRALRLDPYYGATARAHPDYAVKFDALIASVWGHPRCLVHADFSPKNLLVYDGGMMMVDFETGHFGDPAFDLGFFLSHLVLKAFEKTPRHGPYLAMTERFWQAYERKVVPRVGRREYTALVGRSTWNFAGCAWARLDGTSGIDYLTDSRRRDAVRDLCRKRLSEPPSKWEAVVDDCRSRLAVLAEEIKR
jgi:5-methylthioribose kinase